MSNQDTGYIGLVDYDREKSGFGFGVPGIGGVLPVGPLLTLIDALRNSLPAITLGLVTNQKVSLNDQYVSAATAATNPSANRETKWLVTYEDISPLLGIGIDNPGYLKVFNAEIPTANLALRVGNNPVVWTDGGASNVVAFDPFVTAFEAVARSPYGGGIRILKIEDVSRST